MAKKNFQGDLYERTVNGETQYRRFLNLDTSRVARAQVAAEGWVKSAGKTPVGVTTSEEKPKAKGRPAKTAVPDTETETDE